MPSSIARRKGAERCRLLEVFALEGGHAKVAHVQFGIQGQPVPFDVLRGEVGLALLAVSLGLLGSAEPDVACRPSERSLAAKLP